MDKQQSKKIRKDDFIFGEQLGEGAYSRVLFTQKKDDKECYAVKIVNKEFIQKEDKVRSVMSERSALLKFKHPFISRLHYSFQDGESLYFVIQYCPGGDLASMIKQFQQHDMNCPPDVVQFYFSELIQALDYIHNTHHAVHRDLKPENILLQSNGHIALTDFGTVLFLDEVSQSKDDSKTSKRSRGYTFCGSSSFMAPEVLDGKIASIGSDLWSAGCILYQLFTGNVLFFEDNDYLIFERISSFSPDDLIMPSYIPSAAQDIIRRLLAVDPSARIGAHGYSELYSHPYFVGVDFAHLSQHPSPFIPTVRRLPSLLSTCADDDISEEGALIQGKVLEQAEPFTGISQSISQDGVSSEQSKSVDVEPSQESAILNKIYPESDIPTVDLSLSQIPLSQVVSKDLCDWDKKRNHVDEGRKKQAFTVMDNYKPEINIIDKKLKSTDRCYDEFLDASEEVIYNSVVLPGNCFSIYKRLLVLTTRPRIFCLNLRNGKLELNLSLKEITNVKFQTEKCFSFNDAINNKKYSFRSVHGDMKMWVETINSMIHFINGEV